MARAARRPTIFIGSSSEALGIARQVSHGLEAVADVALWDTAFDAGTWLLGGILNRARDSDFGLFVIHKDDTQRIKRTSYQVVRDNVLFEVGVFMGTLGPERTILLWPSASGSSKLRLPTDLAGLLRESYGSPRTRKGKADILSALASIRRRIQRMGPALRNGYNEIAALKQALLERDIEGHGVSTSLLDIVRLAARRRRRPWFSTTSVETLTEALAAHLSDKVVDLVFWWLVIYGVITFDNVEQWNDNGMWDYADSQDYAVFTERGVVLLNELRARETSLG